MCNPSTNNYARNELENAINTPQSCIKINLFECKTLVSNAHTYSSEIFEPPTFSHAISYTSIPIPLHTLTSVNGHSFCAF